LGSHKSFWINFYNPQMGIKIALFYKDKIK
jgi:hypothetical protein